MKNILIAGCPRSGTSMFTGALAETGYYWNGTNTWKDEFNPKGYFEDSEVRFINDSILATCIQSLFVTRGRSHPDTQHAPHDAFWISLLEPWIEPVLRNDVRLRMEKYLAQIPSNKPFILKDPCFSYALSAWYPFINHNTTFVCVFRDPFTTAKSIVKMCGNAPHLKVLNIDMKYAFDLWQCMNRRIVDNYCAKGDWLFVHANQLFDSKAKKRIEERIGHPLKEGFADTTLMSKPNNNEEVPFGVQKLYQELCQLAEYSY